MSGLTTLLHEIERYALIQAEKDKGFKLNPPAGPKAWPVFKKHAVDSAKSLWHSMDDALSHLSKTVKAKKTSKATKDPKALEAHQVEQGEYKGKGHTHAPQAMQEIDSNRYAGDMGQSHSNQQAGHMKQTNSFEGRPSWNMGQGNHNFYGGNVAVMGQINDNRYARKA